MGIVLDSSVIIAAERRGRTVREILPSCLLSSATGNVRSLAVANVTGANLRRVLKEHVEPSAHVMTDDSPVYKTIGKKYARRSSVNHSTKESLRREPDGTHVTTNTVEGFFSAKARGVRDVSSRLKAASSPLFERV